MADRTGDPSALQELRRELAEKSRQLSELDLMLADYHAEHVRLIRELRRLQSRIRKAEESLRPATRGAGDS